jgi:CRISPR-associated protein Cmr4
LREERKMFEKTSALFLYCVSPLHMGSGTALGVIDNPIQRERHTSHPIMIGSGIKGALRHWFWREANGDEAKRRELAKVFGPETADSSAHAGAVSLSDAQMVLFPVRSLRGAFVYATSPTALARLQRILALAGLPDAEAWSIPRPKPMHAVVLNDDLLGGHDNQLILEALAFEPSSSGKEELSAVAEWLGENALPAMPGMNFFREKIKTDTVLLNDDQFDHFVQHATVVEPHVRINDASGTADEGGLFYTENLPPESLLVALVMASRERVKKGEKANGEWPAERVLGYVSRLDGRLLQMGGDGTTGRGQVMLRFVGASAAKGGN